MLAKLTAKNQLTLPKSITNQIFQGQSGSSEPTVYFDAKVEHGQIILTPVKIQRADAAPKSSSPDTIIFAAPSLA